MINLIPPQAKKSIQKEYWVRVVTTWLYLWSVTLLCGATALVPAYVLISSQSAAYADSASQASQQVADYNTVSTALVRASQQARYVLDVRETQPVTPLIALLEHLQGTAIQLNTISIQRAEAGISPVQVSGVAQDRQTLAAFRDSLLAQEVVTAVDLPISNLASDKDIKFSITLTIKPTSDI